MRAGRLTLSELDRRLRRLGLVLLRASLVLIFSFFGYTKFFAYEAAALAPLFAESPLIGWLPRVFGDRGASAALGVAELTTAVLLASRVVAPALSVLGGLMACATFAVTLSLMLSSSSGVWEASAGGFPALGGLGAFLIKDAVLLAASVVLAGESLGAALRRAPAGRIA